MDLDIDFIGDSAATKTPPPESVRRAKSSLRLKYEAETYVIERKLGDLESIREKLGLSQRKIAQLLLVDPSAWTRWTKGPEGARDQAPPHIYRMLQWYLALEEKYPALDVNFWLNTVAQPRDVTGKALLLTAEKTEKLSTELQEARVRIKILESRYEEVTANSAIPISPSVQNSSAELSVMPAHLPEGAVERALYGRQSSRRRMNVWLLVTALLIGIAVGVVAMRALHS